MTAEIREPREWIDGAIIRNISNRVTFALLVVVLTVLWMLVGWPPTGSADMAAWAQALTTAAALIVALFMPVWQHHRELQQRDAEQRRTRALQLESAFQLGHAVQGVCEKVKAHCAHTIPSSTFFRNAVGELHALRAMLDKFRPDHFDGYKELEPAVSVMSAADALIAQFRFAEEHADQQDMQPYALSVIGGIESSLKTSAK